MKTTFSTDGRIADVLISFLVLGCLLWFTYGTLFAAPYSGFYFNPTDGEILEIYTDGDPSTGLRVGDLIEKIGSTTMSQYHENRNFNFFQGLQAGDTVTISVLRDGEPAQVNWVFPGFNHTEFVGRFINLWWLAYVFWMFGTATQVAMRPKDLRWRLLIAANYLMALFIIFGNLSVHQLWMSSPLLHAVAWLILPVYIQFHWIFPTPLRGTSRLGWLAFYAICSGLAIAEIFFLLPRSLYFLAVLLALGGSMALLFFRYFRRPAQRNTVRMLATGALLALVPTLIPGIMGIDGRIPQLGPLALLALPIMPGTYFYAVYRGRLGGLEIRSNRAMSIYAFLTLLGTTLVLLIGFIGPIDLSPGTTILAFVIIAILAAWFAILVFPTTQAFIEKRLLNIRLPYENLPETYSARITTSASMSDLIKLLDEEVFPSLLVKQYAFVRLTKSSATVLASKNVTTEQVREEPLMELLASFQTHKRLPLWEEGQLLGWIRLILPLQLDFEMIGAWLLGRRDPDDLYPQAELPILQSLADQTAVALSNILQAERLRRLYADDIERNEKRRLQLALELHDSVLHQLAILRLNVDEASVSPRFQKAYEEVTSQLREIVTDLRPPMLGYGLQFAIEELADNLMERSHDRLKVNVNIQAKGEVRHPENIERHIFRIMQEACENAIRHGDATQINIVAKLDEGSVSLLIEDNGTGFQIPTGADLETLLANKHFGLAGIVERAMLIGAKVDIDSSPNAGARVQVEWNKTEG